tara:strand:+ start:688 stop:870 length:183 start_codon:yes stop_codon:yes gene_type:complete
MRIRKIPEMQRIRGMVNEARARRLRSDHIIDSIRGKEIIVRIPKGQAANGKGNGIGNEPE